MNLASDIKDLILLNEGVILPGLGGFVTKYHPAQFRKNSNVFDPPSMDMKFDPRMLTDNGLLVSRVAKKNNLSEVEARSVVIEYVESLKKDLQEKGAVTIDEVGMLVKDSNGSLTLQVAADKNYHIQSFGLPAVEIPPSLKPPEMPGRTLPPPVVQTVSKKKFGIPIAAIIAAIIVAGAGLVYFTGLFDRVLKPLFLNAEPVLMDSGDDQDKIVFGHPVTTAEDSLALEVNKQLAERSSKEKALLYNEPAKIHPALPQHNPVKTETPLTRLPADQTGEFHIVAGSFLIPNNANRQKSELEKKGYTPRIIRKNDDFFYVTLQAFDSKETAVTEMRKLSRELDLPLWVMSR